MPFWKHLKDYTVQELLAVVYPYCVAIPTILILIMYCLEQDMTGLIFASVPGKFKTGAVFALCLTQEAHQFHFAFQTICLIFQVHILFQTKVNKVLESLIQRAKRNGRRTVYAEANWIFGKVREVQLVVNMFNIGHRYVIYCTKLFCITCATVNGYGLIAHGGAGNLVYTLLTFTMFVDMLFLYAFVYEKAFGIPEGLDSVKRALGSSIQGIGVVRGRKILRRQVRSVPIVGFKVGDFHMLERESTPIFIQYIVTNIVNLLVML